MFCSDPFLTYLKAFGYSVIRLPKADVRPLPQAPADGATRLKTDAPFVRLRGA